MEQATEPTAGDERAARWEDYVDVFFSPVELFARRARDRVGPPLLTLIALALAFYFLLIPATRMVARASAAEAAAVEVMERFEGVFTVLFAVATPFLYLAVVVSTAALLWLVGRSAGIRTEFSRTMLIATYAAFVYLLAQVLGSVAVMIQGEAGLDVVRHVSFGPLRFVGSAGMDPALMAILRRFELFNLWQAVLWAVGLRVIYDVSYARAGVVAGITWLLFVIPGLIGSLFNVGSAATGG